MAKKVKQTSRARRRNSKRSRPKEQLARKASNRLPKIFRIARDKACAMIASEYAVACIPPFDRVPQLHVYGEPLTRYLNEAERLLMIEASKVSEIRTRGSVAVVLARTVRAVRFLTIQLDNPTADLRKLGRQMSGVLDDIYEHATKRGEWNGPSPFPDGLDVSYDDRRADGARMLLNDAEQLHQKGLPHRDIARFIERKARKVYPQCGRAPPIDLDHPKIASGRDEMEKLVSAVGGLLGLPRHWLNFLDNEQMRRAKVGSKRTHTTRS